MAIEKVLPETLHQLLVSVLSQSKDFELMEGIMPFRMRFKNKEYYVYSKNLSSAYFKDRPASTRAQLGFKEEFSTIKQSSLPFIFFGYDKDNDVLVCWNYHFAKKRLNEKKSVSFYSNATFQEKVVAGEFLRRKLKNEDIPVFMKRKDLVSFFENIENFFDEISTNETKTNIQTDKILSITDKQLLDKLKPLLDTENPHTLEAIKIVQEYYGFKPYMKFRDWALLVKGIVYNS